MGHHLGENLRRRGRRARPRRVRASDKVERGKVGEALEWDERPAIGSGATMS
jgi:hypothetical protein